MHKKFSNFMFETWQNVFDFFWNYLLFKINEVQLFFVTTFLKVDFKTLIANNINWKHHNALFKCIITIFNHFSTLCFFLTWIIISRFFFVANSYSKKICIVFLILNKASWFSILIDRIIFFCVGLNFIFVAHIIDAIKKNHNVWWK